MKAIFLVKKITGVMKLVQEKQKDASFMAKYFAKDLKGNLRPKQFVDKGVFGQDWLGNDERIPFGIIGTNMCQCFA
jgi:hypothetical protein